MKNNVKYIAIAGGALMVLILIIFIGSKLGGAGKQALLEGRAAKQEAKALRIEAKAGRIEGRTTRKNCRAQCRGLLFKKRQRCMSECMKSASSDEA